MEQKDKQLGSDRGAREVTIVEQVFPVQFGLLESMSQSKSLLILFIVLSIILGSFFGFLIYMA